ncbi:DUF1643 domain-containing protein [Marinobacter sp. X15-166B]|uniref:DUF1643 domain-containing protein n=1 Tax=Marinobacter sp. X15-166B TaxID=1897620 RepID=UPI00085BB791|nr:DUF1643 domain-containing protein [Marinobacter sp. X15-166B]OEY65963.1 hypothetical protein BG841_05495 [Marinobacter sp. X15-166B]
MRAAAKFSECGRYRYALWRIWDDTRPWVMFIGLNPSAVDEVRNNPTINRCIRFAQSWGYGGVCVVNLFAFKATVPTEMMSAADPIGPDNDQWLTDLAKEAGLVVAAWGNDGAYLGRSAAVQALFSDLHCIKLNKSGEPAHPLYLSGTLTPVPYNR